MFAIKPVQFITEQDMLCSYILIKMNGMPLRQMIKDKIAITADIITKMVCEKHGMSMDIAWLKFCK